MSPGEYSIDMKFYIILQVDQRQITSLSVRVDTGPMYLCTAGIQDCKRYYQYYRVYIIRKTTLSTLLLSIIGETG